MTTVSANRVRADRVPLTVVGGYLGAGKTTLVNRLLQQATGTRLGVIVNDFGSIGIDVELLAGTARADGSAVGPDQIVSLPNGCVCCTIGSGLHDALARLLAYDPPPDHVVIEVSGVADPAAAAAWATVPPFEPGGVVVLAAADSIRAMASDRYVGDEVVRQLVGADMILITKSDLCEPSAVRDVEDWIDHLTGGVARLSIVDGVVPPSVLLGVEPASASVDRTNAHLDHATRYMTWDWSTDRPTTRPALDAFLVGLPAGVLRLKGFVDLDDGSRVVVQRVGQRATVTAEPESGQAEMAGARPIRSAGAVLVAIGLTDLAHPDELTSLAASYFVN